jgi:cytochrome c peroxidase/serine/threonine protein kinase
MGHPPSVPVVGDVVAGKYRVERILGQGGMGVVVAAEHLSLRQRVAVKFLLPQAPDQAEAVERFEREARAAAAIQSPHVARILDVGIGESGASFIVMEYLTGHDLGVLVRERGRLPAAEAVGYLLQTCEAMAEAHARGIVHRDLKPSNLFLSVTVGGPPQVKILDFGLAKALSDGADGAHEDSITKTNLVMGSVHYMSPEQVRSLKQADLRSDIWALGVTLYELVTGQRPFRGTSMAHSFLKITLDPPPPIPPGALPPGLDRIIMRCLEKDPARRPQSIAELAILLAPFGPPEGRVSVDRVLQWQAPPLMPAQPEVEPLASAVPTAAASAVPSAVAPTRTPDTRPRTDTAADTAADAIELTRAPRRRFGWVAVTVVVAAVAVELWIVQRSRSSSDAPAEVETDRLASFAPLPTAPRPDATTAARIELGEVLFADPRLSRNGDVACTTCHPLERYGADGRKLSRGSDNREPPRNTPSIYNLSGVFALLWDGRKDDLVDQAKEVLLSPHAMAATPELLAKRLRGVADYASRFKAAFGGKEAVSFDNIARALAAYEDTLFSRGRWDRFLEGDRAALTADERAGFNRFVEVGCVTCHFGPNVGATMFQKLGLVKAWPDSRDRGRFEITRRSNDWMVFRVPPLRNVEKTGPYFHDGSVSNLDTAIVMMARHQLGKELEPDDVRLIHAWLGSLTGQVAAPATEPESERAAK